MPRQGTAQIGLRRVPRARSRAPALRRPTALVIPSGGDGRLQAHLSIVNAWLQSVGGRSQTEYARDLEAYESWWRATGGETGGELAATPADAVEYRDHLIEEGAAPATIARRLAALSSLWGYAGRMLAPRGIPLHNPWTPRALRRPRVPDHLAERILDEEQMAALIEAAGKRGPMVYAAVLLLYDTGIRTSEATSLTWRQVYRSHKGMAVEVLGKGGKTRRLPLSRRAHDALVVCRHGDYLIHDPAGDPLSRFSLRRRIRAAGRDAGLPDPFTTHWTRHSALSHALWHGAPLTTVQHAAGHASVRTTDRYTHVQADSGLTDWIPGAERAK